ncbi:hypothetical protein [Candidatus Poriferisocius sp.]|uniref:hypothetical protein n=1 Tax=Candidatus Poriferisocius sp. TaxID=3101276 RepID=UPI003B02E904
MAADWGAFTEGLMGGMSNTLTMWRLKQQIDAQKKMEQYKEGLKQAVDAGDLAAAQELAMGFGDMQTANALQQENERRTAQSFDRMARENPMLAEEADPGRFVTWKRHEEAANLTLEQAQAQLARTQQATAHEAERHPLAMAQGQAGLAATQMNTRIAGEQHAMNVEDRLTGKEQAALSRSAREVIAATGGDMANLGQAIPAMNRSIEENRPLYQKLYGLEKHRIPVGVELVDGPNGPELAVKIYNKKTDSVGPMTAKGTPDGDDEVVSDNAEVVFRMLEHYAGMGGGPEKMEKGRFKVQVVGDSIIRLDTATGDVTELGNAPMEPVESDFISGFAQDLMGGGMFADLSDPDKETLTALNKVGNEALSMGFDEAQIRTAMTHARDLLTGDGELAKKHRDAKSWRERNEVLVEVMKEIGFPFEEAKPEETGITADGKPAERQAPEAPPERPKDEFVPESRERTPEEESVRDEAAEAMRQGSPVMPGLIPTTPGETIRGDHRGGLGGLPGQAPPPQRRPTRAVPEMWGSGF